MSRMHAVQDSGVHPKDHLVLFYDELRVLVETVAAFVDEGLTADEAIILVMTPPHFDAVRSELFARGHDVDAARTSGQLRLLDASDTLATFDRNGHLLPERFVEVVGGVVGDAIETGRTVRAFGEMVALLWQAGRPAAAIELETMWCQLRGILDFSLLCAYPSVVLAHEHHEEINGICATHSEVIVNPRRDTQRLQAFPAQNSSPREARDFVASYLGNVENPAAVDKALLIVSELATNAVLHARTPFVVEVRDAGDVIWVAVRDGDVAKPEPGRGLELVEAASREWGVDSAPAGKVIWAEIAAF